MAHDQFSLIVLWVASLFKILLASWSPTKATFLINAGSLLPTINYLTSIGHNIHILCMSTGNANANANESIRKEELYQASAILKVPLQQVKILDYPDFQDGFGKVWDCELLARIVGDEIHAYAIDVIVTVDRYGVSSHCNHCDVNRGVRKLLHGASQRKIEAWELVSTNILHKYSGPADIWFSILYAMHLSDGLHCVLNKQRCKAMLQWRNTYAK